MAKVVKQELEPGETFFGGGKGVLVRSITGARDSGPIDRGVNQGRFPAEPEDSAVPPRGQDES